MLLPYHEWYNPYHILLHVYQQGMVYTMPAESNVLKLDRNSVQGLINSDLQKISSINCLAA